MGLFFGFLLYAFFYALILMFAATMLLIWGFLWLLGAVLGIFYVLIGDTARARRAVKRSPSRPIPQARWSNRR